MSDITFCKFCEAEVSADAKFCGSCGAAIDSTDTPDEGAPGLGDRVQKTGAAVGSVVGKYSGAVFGKLRPFDKKTQEGEHPEVTPPTTQVQVQQPAPLPTDRQQPDYYVGSKVLEKVEGMLPGETPYVVVKQSRLRPGGSLLSPAAIVATDQRVLFRNPKFFGLREDLKEITYDQIGSVTTGKGMFGSRINLQTAYFGVVSIDGLSREDVHKLVDVVHWHVDAHKKRPSSQQTVVVQTAAVQQESSVDKLKKLAELRDLGIITPEEFEEKKRQLLQEI